MVCTVYASSLSPPSFRRHHAEEQKSANKPAHNLFQIKADKSFWTLFFIQCHAKWELIVNCGQEREKRTPLARRKKTPQRPYG